MRTSLHFPDRLLAETKRYALEQDTNVTQFVIEAVREKLTQAKLKRSTTSRKRVELPVFHGGSGAYPGINLDKTSELLEIE